MTDQEVAALTGNQAPSRIAHRVDPNDVLAGKASFVPYDGSDPQPGDAVQFQTPNGTYQFLIGEDGSWQLAGAPKTTRGVGASAYQSADVLAPHASAAEKAQYEAIRGDPKATPQDMISAAAALRAAEKEGLTASGKDTDTQALSKAAEAKIAAGQGSKLTQTELTAYFKVHGGTAQGQTTDGQYAMPIAGYSGPIKPHHDGASPLPSGAVDLFAPVGTPVVAIESGTVVSEQPFSDHGSGSGTGDNVLMKGQSGRYYWYQHLAEPSLLHVGDPVTVGEQLGHVGQTGYDPKAAPPHLHLGISASNTGLAGNGFNDFGEGTGVEAQAFLQNVEKGGQPGTGGNPFMSTKPEIHALGDKLYQYDPATGSWSVAVDASGLKAPTTHQIGNTLYQWDPNSRKWQQAIVGPDTTAEIQAKQAQQGKFLTLLQQADSTRAYIKQQYLSGTITAQQMADYGKNLDAYTQAALQGSTPWEMHYQEQQLENNRAATAKDLLDTAMTQTNTAANDLLSHAITGTTQSKYGILPDNTLSDLYQGSLQQSQQQAKPLTDLAQTLLQGIGAHAQAAGLDPRMPVTGAAGGTPADTNPLDQYAMRLPGMEGSNIPPPQPQPVAA